MLHPSPSPSHPLSTFRYFLIPPENVFVLACRFLRTSSTRPLNSKQSTLPHSQEHSSGPESLLQPWLLGWSRRVASWTIFILTHGDKENHPKPEMWELVSHCSSSAPSSGNRGSSLRSEVPCHTRNLEDSSSICPQSACTLNAPATCC